MLRWYTFITLFLSFSALAQNPLAGTRWGTYMTGPGGGYLMSDYEFHEDTVFIISTNFNIRLPFAKYQVDDDQVIIHAIPNFDCVNDPDTFSFTIIVDLLDFVPHSASCASNIASLAPYLFIRVTGVGVTEVGQPIPILLWPNPANEVLNIRLPAGLPPGAQIAIINATGAEVARHEWFQDIQSVPIGQLAPGFYHVQASGAGNLYRQQFMVTR
jgi:hypothetical protein